MAIPIKQLRAALAAWLAPLNVPVVWQFQNTPDPKLAPRFITINPAPRYARVGLHDDSVYNPDTETIELVQHRAGFASIQALGPGAFELLASAIDRLELPSVYESFSALGIAAWTGELRDLTALKGALYERRAQFDLDWRLLAGAENEGGEFGPITEGLLGSNTIRYDAPLVGEYDIIITTGD
jgi:hypothetical protein